MKLVFDIIKSGDDTSLKRNFHFNKEGGTIGRSLNASWQLKDSQSFISNIHLEIEYKDEVYFIKDDSTNGTYLKFPYKRLPRGNRIKINSTDIYILGDQEIQARFVEDSFSEDINEKLSSKLIIPDDDFLEDNNFDSLEDQNESIENIINDKKEEKEVFKKEENEISNKLEEQHVRMPNVSKKENKLHRKIDNTSLQRSVEILEDKLGIDICSLDKNDRDIIMSEIGDIILNTLSGLKHSLYLKNKINDDLKISDLKEELVTVNPIALGENASKLLQNKENGGLLGMSKISDAVNNSFKELNNHNLTFHTCAKNIMKISVLKFSPKELEYSFERKGVLKSFLVPRRVMIWRAYKEQFDRLNHDPEFGYDLISSEFANEYKNTSYSIKLASNKNLV